MDKLIYGVIAILTAISTGLFAILVYRFGRPDRATGLYCLWAASVCLWSAFLALNIFATSQAIAFAASKLLHAAAILIPAFYLHFVMVFLKKEAQRKRLIMLSYVVAAVMLFFNWIPQFVSISFQDQFGFYVSKPAFLYPIHPAIFVLTVIYSLAELIHCWLREENLEAKNQILYFLLATFVGYGGGLTNYLVNYGISVYPIYPYGNLTIFLYLSIIGYGIARHQLIGIRVIFKKTLIYSVLAATASAIYLILIFTMNQLAQFIVVNGVSFEPTADNVFLLKHHIISHVIACITTLCLGVFVYLAGKKNETNIVFALYTLAISVWSGFGAFALMSHSAAQALMLWRVSLLGVVFIAVLFVHFVLSLLNAEERSSRRPVMLLAYVAGVVLSSSIIFGLVPSRVEAKYYLPNYTVTTPLYWTLFITWTLTTGYGLFELFRLRHNSTAERHNQLNYFCLATLIAYVGGIGNFLPSFNVFIPYFMPFGNYLIPIYVVASVYAILSQKLMDIRIALRKAFFYAMLAVVISVLYILLIFFVYGLWAPNANESRIAANFMSLLAIALLFKPLEMLMLRILDKRFFRGSISEIAEQNKLLQTELERRERLKSVGILASGMAHEIKNPLTAINTFIDYLPQKYDDPAFRENFQRILKTEIGRIKEILQELLEYSKPKPLSKIDVDIDKIIRDTIELLSKDVLSAKVKIEFNPGLNPRILIDPDRIKQALLNIMLNGIEAMREHGGTMKIETSSGSEYLEICIADQGCGIAGEDVKRIFDPFFTKKERGTGLGLAITHSIIEQHGGKIQVESSTGAGSRFIITLPRT